MFLYALSLVILNPKNVFYLSSCVYKNTIGDTKNGKICYSCSINILIYYNNKPQFFH